VTDHGVPVHVGEWGCNNKTPHEVCLAFMGDELSLWKEAGWGWSIWNLRGSFGIVDSGRGDVAYEDFQGHKLDRKMLELLQAG
jgi:endoglucanase